MSVAFDLNRLEVTDSPIALIQGVSTGNAGAAQATFADPASLMYVTGGGRPGERTLTWVDRKGTEQPLQLLPPRAFQHPRLSPNGQRVVFNIDEGNKSDVWIYDLRRGSLDKLTSEGASFPIWTSNGEKVTFVSTKTGPSALFWKTADIRGTEELLAPSGRVPGSWSPKGETLAFADRDPATGLDIWTLSLTDGKPQPFARTPFHEFNPAFSADGRWVAYQSNKSGLTEVYLEEFPGPGKVKLVSSQGGEEPVWSRDGPELFYRSGAKMMAVANPFEGVKPVVLFEGPYSSSSPRNYDVASDSRFLMLKESEQVAGAIQINVVLNWQEELKRRVPTK
jgi:eukaryotic-like serine/threonine-protein kinase